VLEQTSARVLTPAHIDRSANWVVCDASFIALRKVLEVPLALAARPTRLVALIKPQFEVGRAKWARAAWCAIRAARARLCRGPGLA
jgi:23S rRNA (cytidine1920-2'-O)/16S rRNA (cytidine1409-2'-O)-methyltransferase